ncbi:MAG: DUF4190 domain-containing protein [Christensenella sp.]|uniref:DUF4190 domain-containing protein n=1 Tax=Christensenella sp. TaxID=1935934 RepID=UPI002B1F7793|nr:DUF4190 domain-containing protein [Christensenella sp.]MEA5004608.1 DUF4190 domain-containing protein [Christensenella sp.]
MICKKCEQSYSDALPTCPYCGASKEPVEEKQAVPDNNQAYQQAPGQQPPPQGQKQYGGQYQQQYQQQPQYQQPQYQQQQPPQYNAAQQEGKGRGTGSMVCGILGLIFCWVPFVGLILTIVAVALYASSRKYGSSGMATAGLVCGIIGMIVAIIVTIVSIIAVAFVGVIGASAVSMLPYM